MKHAKRIFCLTLALLMAIGVAACGGDTTLSDGVVFSDTGPYCSLPANPSYPVTPPVTSDPVRPEEMQGKTYLILQEAPAETPFGFDTETTLFQELVTHMAEVEERYGCTLEFLQLPANDLSQSQMVVFELGGVGDIFFGLSTVLRRSLRNAQGEMMFENILKYDHIINFWDIQKWGNIYARECLMMEGEFYGVTPALWQDCTPLPLYCVVYNKGLIEDCGEKSPLEYWEEEEWDNFAMVQVIKNTTSVADDIWGMTASLEQMVHATVLATGKPLVEVAGMQLDGSVVWKNNLDSAEIITSLQWLQFTMNNNAKCFNKGLNDWEKGKTHEPFLAGTSALALTSPAQALEMVKSPGNHIDMGIITWAGVEANQMTGGYGEVTAVAIPTFAQNTTHSAYLVFDLFKGVGDIRDYSQLHEYYLQAYFSHDTDVTCFLQQDGKTGYSYWVEGSGSQIHSISNSLLATKSVKALVEKYLHDGDSVIENHVATNWLSLEKWRQGGKMD